MIMCIMKREVNNMKTFIEFVGYEETDVFQLNEYENLDKIMAKKMLLDLDEIRLIQTIALGESKYVRVCISTKASEGFIVVSEETGKLIQKAIEDTYGGIIKALPSEDVDRLEKYNKKENEDEDE